MTLFFKFSFMSEMALAWIVLPTQSIISAGTTKNKRLLKYRIRLKNKLIGTVSQKFEWALILLSNSMFFDPIGVFDNLRCFTTFLKSFI